MYLALVDFIDYDSLNLDVLVLVVKVSQLIDWSSGYWVIH